MCDAGPLLIGGTDKRACLWSADGVEVLELVVRDAWVWSAQIISIDEKTFLAIGTNDGTISVYSLQWKNEYTIHGDWFAQRESWNAVSIQRLPRDDKTTVSSTQLIRHFCLHLVIHPLFTSTLAEGIAVGTIGCASWGTDSDLCSVL